MKKTVLITIAFALLAAASYAQQPEIPAPAGATLITEINLSDSDILGMIKQALPAFAQAFTSTPGEVNNFVKQLDIDSFSAAIEGIHQVRILQFDIPKTANTAKMFDFYQEKFSADNGWSRIVYDISMAPAKAGAVYTHGGQEYLAVGVDAKANRLFVARTVGFVDVPKLAAWFGNAVKAYFQIADTQQTIKSKPEQKQPPKTVSPAKKTAPAPKAPVKK
ncbi:MAG: hypothetical protein ABFD64_03400 [Armatimonadota bacterium]